MSRCPETPFILVTGAVSEDRVIEMLTQGAKDYVLKSRLNRLASAVGRVLKEAQELKARRAAEQEMLDASLYVRSLIEASLDPLLVISTEGIIIDVNAAAEKMAGIPRNLAIGTDYAMNCTDSLCREVWNEVVNAFPCAGALFEIGSVPDAYGDKSLIRQVLANLFANALKYSRNSDPARIEIGSYPKDRSTVYYVRDNGVGFDMSCYHKLFGAFQCLHSASEFEGTGLGLSIAKRIIDRHRCRIWAESALGRGATFYFTLPAGGLNS